MAAAVLLVEDDELSRQMLSWRLGRRGYAVTTAEDGIDCLDRVRAAPPDVILLDMSLPALDGWDVAQRLKADPDLRHIPIIALTAHAMRGDRDRAIKAGCDEYETKPVEFARLLEKMEALLNGGQS